MIAAVSNPLSFNSSDVSMPTMNATTLQYLKFRLDPNTQAMLPIKQITEVLKIQLGQIMPIPQMPPWVMGVYNWRGDVLWMLDLGQLLELDSWSQPQHQPAQNTAIVLSPHRESKNNEQKIHLGLVVAGVDDLESCNLKEIQPTIESQINSRLSSFLQGYWLKPSGEMILAVDGMKIASAMPKNY